MGCFTTMTLASGSCRQAIAGFAYKSATDPECVALKSTECRCADFTASTGSRGSGVETCASECTAAGTASGAAGAGGDGEGADAAAGGAGKGGESFSFIYGLFFTIIAM